MSPIKITTSPYEDQKTILPRSREGLSQRADRQSKNEDSG
jgi:hypothetical protein